MPLEVVQQLAIDWYTVPRDEIRDERVMDESEGFAWLKAGKSHLYHISPYTVMISLLILVGEKRKLEMKLKELYEFPLQIGVYNTKVMIQSNEEWQQLLEAVQQNIMITSLHRRRPECHYIKVQL